MSIRNQTGVYERTLHDREIDTPYPDECFEITDDFVQCLDTRGKALEKSLKLLFLQNKLHSDNCLSKDSAQQSKQKQ